MIDINSRKNALKLLEELKQNRLTTDEFEDRWPVSKDPALNGILRWLWLKYSDNSEVGFFDGLEHEDKLIINNCREFLSSTYEFPMQKLSFFEKIKEKLKWGVEWNVECSLPESKHWPLPSKSTKL